MTDEHLFNSLRMLRRMKDRGPRFQDLLEEVEKRWTDERSNVVDDPPDIMDDLIIGGCDSYGSLSGCESR